MKSIRFKNIGICLSLFIFICTATMSQTSYVLNPENSKMTILGTSSLHDWEMVVRDINCSAKLTTDGKNISGIQDTRFSAISTSIVSDYKLMDKKTYDALKAEEFSSINFKMIDGEILSVTGDKFNGMVTGYLSIAGQTKEVKVPFSGSLLENGQLKLKGKVDLKMSEFKIDPPTALMGTLKTGDNVSIVYSFELEKSINNQISEVKTGSRDTDN